MVSHSFSSATLSQRQVGLCESETRLAYIPSSRQGKPKKQLNKITL